ncbi:MAG: hypothetical protein ACOVOW_01915 [Spirosomataceae bacterium]
MNKILRQHIVFRFFCLAIALQFIGVNTGVVAYVSHFFEKGKSISSIKTESEDERDNDSASTDKKSDNDSQDDFDESYIPHDYQQTHCHTYLQRLIIQHSTSYFFYQDCKTLNGYFDIVFPPPRLLMFLLLIC